MTDTGDAKSPLKPARVAEGADDGGGVLMLGLGLATLVGWKLPVPMPGMLVPQQLLVCTIWVMYLFQSC